MERAASSAAPILMSVLLVVTGLSCLGCGGETPEIRVSYPGGDAGSSFRLVNASVGEWSDVQVTIRELRPDGVEAECATRQFPSWQPGAAQALPKCGGGDKTLITIEAADQKAFFVLAEGKLYQKFGRREILIGP